MLELFSPDTGLFFALVFMYCTLTSVVQRSSGPNDEVTLDIRLIRCKDEPGILLLSFRYVAEV
ncbi:hypothetical protein D3C72_2268170 [compost metagenome]